MRYAITGSISKRENPLKSAWQCERKEWPERSDMRSPGAVIVRKPLSEYLNHDHHKWLYFYFYTATPLPFGGRCFTVKTWDGCIIPYYHSSWISPEKLELTGFTKSILIAKSRVDTTEKWDEEKHMVEAEEDV